MSSSEKASFGAVDYAVFCASLILSLGIGVYQWWKSRGGDSKDFLVGGGNMSPIPVAISLFAGMVSAVSLLGNSSEMYYYGSQLWINCAGTAVGTVLAGVIIIPVLYPLKLVSLYEILELRWRSTLARKLATGLMMVNFVIYAGIALYAPSLALSSVTPIPANISVAVMGIVCTIYASIGGAKAVVYTDTVQAFIMLAGIVAVIIQGCIEVGGGATSWEIDQQNGRIEFFNMSADALTRHTFMSTFILGIFFAFNAYGISQQQYQRWISVATMKQSYMVVTLSCLILIAIWSLINYSGLVVYSVYADCDPYTAGFIDKTDQISAYFVIDKLGYLTGVPGLFVAAIYSGVLSSVSSVLNAVAAMIWEDLFKGLESFKKFTVQQQKKTTIIISSISGVICTALGLLAGKMGGLFQITYALSGAIGGPVAGYILTAITCPWVKVQSAITGLLASITLTMWMVLGNFLLAPAPDMLPLSVDGCPNGTVSFETTLAPIVTTTESSGGDGDDESEVFPLYLVTYCMYGAIGTVTTWVIANLATLIFGAMDIEDVPEETIHKQCMRFYRWLRSNKGESNQSLKRESSIKKSYEQDSIGLSQSSIDDGRGSRKGSGGGSTNPTFVMQEDS